ncbi:MULTISPECIES: hypothetical protein [unclassified Bacillus (in: firmicutes)]|uniref:hypothetical protein n=1 Tax=unclassified Bacillus (in: firmicutes) TaxID=185979 RepID=UPI001596AC9D|nr:MULTISPECIES: hypothetical protein [unclassified Bacillus (in: firmicutes)]
MKSLKKWLLNYIVRTTCKTIKKICAITSVNQAVLYRKLGKPNKNQKTDSLNT